MEIITGTFQETIGGMERQFKSTPITTKKVEGTHSHITQIETNYDNIQLQSTVNMIISFRNDESELHSTVIVPGRQRF